MEGFNAPTIDWYALSPVLVTLGGAVVVLLVALFLPVRVRRDFSAAVAALCFLAAAALAVALFVADDTGTGIVADAIRRDRLADFAQVLVLAAGLLTVLVSYREPARNDRAGEYYALLLTAAGGMAFFVAANNLMTLFLGLEWFSICLYILTAIAVERLSGLEASLKYLIVGSFGSAILLFGSAFVYGATGAIGFEEIAAGTEDAERLFVVAGLAMIIVGLAFKASAAPFHMWTPDVYEGAPTPVTGFMAAATKVAALVVTLRLLVVAFPSRGGALDGRARGDRLLLARVGEPGRDRADEREATARVLEHLPRRLPAHADRGRERARWPRASLLLDPVRGHEPRRLRRRRRAGTRTACSR